MNNKEIYAALSRGELLVTPTKRLAREITAAFNRSQIEHDAGTWPTARVLPWQAWMVALAEQAGWSTDDHRMVLNTEQARVVWEDVLQDSGLLAPQVPASSMVAEVMRAYRSAAEYLIDIPSQHAALNDNIEAFASWAREYAARLTERGWIDPSCLPVVIEEYLRAGWLISEPINLVCTEELCTAHRRLLEAMTSVGWQVNQIKLERLRGRPTKVQAASPEDEIEQAARWAKKHLQATPQRRLAVIVSDLADSRDRVARTFTEVLSAKSLLPGADGSALPFHISIGHTLAQQTMISEALALLDWVCGEIGLGTVSRVLRAQYLAPDPEAVWKRAGLETYFRSRGWRNVELSTVVAQNRRREDPDLGMDSTLAALAELADSELARALPSIWAERFDGWLARAGWPGYRTLSSVEFQVLAAWKGLLGDFSRLDQVAAPLESAMALARLKKLARDKVFQAEAEELPVQIMDPREAQGLHFDGAWMLGWHDEAWPQPSHPSPFLPMAAQISARVPGSGPDVQYDAAVATFERLGGLAQECVFSWAGRQDERPLRPSALIDRLDSAQAILADHEDFSRLLQRNGKLEVRPRASLPTISPGSEVAGGIQVLEHQSNCPFRAFAQHRLAAQALEAPGPGIQAIERGTRVHHAMKAIWQRLRSHQRLCSLGQEALGGLIAEEVARAFEGVPVNATGRARGRLVEMERRRVSNLVAALMELERNRPPFTVVELEGCRPPFAVEQREQADLGGLVLNIRPDRVDALPDGRQVILDYKTGKANPADWIRERPKSVQMPVYLVARDDPAHGALFVTLSAGDVRFAGALAEDDLMQADKDQCRRLDWPKKTGLKNWDELLVAWRARYARLAEQFRRGEIQVDPAEKGKVCEYCHLGTLCRVNERGRALSHEQ